MKKHINALLGFVCYTIGVIAAAYYGLWKMLVLPLHTLAVSFLAGDLNVTLLAVCVVKILFSTTMAGLIWCIGYIAYNHFKGTQDPDWETMEKEYMAEKEEKERQASRFYGVRNIMRNFPALHPAARTVAVQAGKLTLMRIPMHITTVWKVNLEKDSKKVCMRPIRMMMAVDTVLS